MDKKKKLAKAKPVDPFIEIGNPDKSQGWSIKPGSGACSMGACPADRVMHIPRGRSEYAHAVRTHEMMHKEWTPWGDSEEVKSIKASMNLILGVEDFRITKKGELAGVADHLHGLMSPGEIRAILKESSNVDGQVSLKSLTSRVISIASIPELRIPLLEEIQAQIYEAHDNGMWARREQFEFLEQTITTCQNYIDTVAKKDPEIPFIHTKHIAEWIEKSGQQFQQYLKGKQAAEEGEGEGKTKGQTPGDEPQGEPGPMALDEYPKLELPGTWARMNFKVSPLTVHRKFKGKGINYGPNAEGVFVRYPHRMLIDGALFTRPRRNYGGTVLVDISSSNLMSVGQLDKFLDTAPGAVIAVYSGTFEPGVDRKPFGEVRVIARHHKRTKKFGPLPGAYNLIDGPALRWLARQKGPRVWVTDGWVSGVGAAGKDEYGRAFSQHLRKECDKICKEGRIYEVRNVEQALKIL